jgi:two-component system sensor histidine kinase KdpD
MAPPRRVALQGPPRPLAVIGYGFAVAGTVAVTAAFVPFRDSLTPVSEAFAFLTLVVGVAWIGGFGAGILASLLAFVAFNFFFIPPYGTFTIASPEHIVVLFVLLGISILISSLLAKTRERADAAESREIELRVLQELSGELVGRVPGKEAYERVLSRLMSLLSYSAASLQLTGDQAGSELNEEVSVGTPPGTLTVQTVTGQRPTPERIPLTVGRHRLGILLLQGDRPPLPPGESRVLRAFSDQLALVLERDRLLRVAAKAETYRSAEKLRRALLTAVSHDLRSPLSAIKASVTDLLDRDVALDPGYQHDVLETVDQEVDRLNALIANLLDMSRIEAGMLRARIQSVDALDTINHCIDRAKRRWNSVGFGVSVDERVAIVLADPVFLERVVSNLIDNAAGASTEADNDKVEVEVRARDDRSTAIRVIDHGKGVTENVREHLFHPFYELDERSSRLGPGLGLAICKGFLDAMGGEVWIEQTPGGGATFAFSLPSESKA